MVRRVTHNHYIASPLEESDSPTPIHVKRSHNSSRNDRYTPTSSRNEATPQLGVSNRGYSTDGEESLRRGATYGRKLNEYSVANEREQIEASSPSPPVAPSRKSKRSQNNTSNNRLHVESDLGGGRRTPSALSYSRSNAYDENGSDIYVTSAAYKAPSEISRGSRYSRHSRSVAPSHYSYRSGARAPSIASTVKTKTSRKGGVTIETMAAPNPFCPNIKGMCCLMLLVNLGLILVCLGFVIVIQFYDFSIWGLGILFLVFGFLTLIGSLVYCVVVCREARPPPRHPDDFYWTHHWQKNIGSPEIHYKAEEKYNDPDRFSDRYSVGKMSNKYSDRGSERHHQRY